MKRSLHLRSGGFTLLEIMLVVMIIALLAGAAIYNMGGTVGIAQRTAIIADINSFKTQLMVYETSNGFLPTTQQGLKAFVERPDSEPRPRNWKKIWDKVPLDPYGMEYQYVNPGVHNPGRYDLFSAGQDRKAGTEDDVGNWENK